jgi:hypothetical protein
VEKTIQINQLLLERETCLSEVFSLEQQISIVLGQRYPLDLPVDLPSLQTRKRKRAVKNEAAAPIRLRELNSAHEYAYRIVYTDQDVRHEELHTDPRALALLLNTDLPRIRVETIDAVALGEDGALTPVETLFRSPPAGQLKSLA